ncbi:thiamine biosynthesis protein ThiS [Thermobispora bispora]|uniref:Thiamine biosynthesis protein ThiS n=1 Tax=Thermobispora bispora (strain ATCC 19993 / DSM 43833 / CBS 139.67 / JCM 10125 / KCTC 9307 / NBRC 14880 / R51) TaxID=469371 RepID=D6Y9D7_THEBD|nr:sulfur carrier protein ThiS [Thermobispora bispora]MBO2474161.1 thiamine biosynthesis protein ThiS [Actinomycetales bacterium]MDI9580866.1 sulfur carrier protein ThiS [Thermobispora sp.]ADG88057.1 thiamine biosynthesis protein ThiS [Thermobispora bispora DSM 43833]MBX6168054.1 sulfur carrier protein ThiS [Thermobispora bispora]QSI47922.1 sulfur carrier protein ThiS [Thermobispora bispora]
MKVVINGNTVELPGGATAADAVRTLTSAHSGVAISINDEVVSRSAWESTPLSEGDRVEVLTAVQGG